MIARADTGLALSEPGQFPDAGADRIDIGGDIDVDQKGLVGGDALADRFAEIARQWAAFPRKGTPLSQLLAVHRNYLDYALAHPHLFDYVFSHAHAGARRFPEDMRGQRSPTLNVVAELVQVAMDEGFLARDDVWEVVMCLWAHSHGLIALYRAGRFSYDATAFRHFHDASLRRLIDGLKA